MDKLYVGVGRTDITPEIGCHLAGYANDVFSDAVHDALTATVLVLRGGEKTVALISLCLCNVDQALVTDLRNGICARHPEVKFEDIIVSAVHTHSGPSTFDSPGWGTKDIPYCDNILIPQVIKAADIAFENMRAAQMGINVAQSRVGINRRQFGPDGEVVLGQNPWGQYDPTMTVIAFRGEDGVPIANMVHYGCHNTSTGRNGYITRDWCGVMIDWLDKESGATTLFFNGCAGDVGPRLTSGNTSGGGNIDFVNQVGSVAAMDAVQAYRGIKEYRTVLPETVTGEIRLPYAPIVPLEKAQAGLEEYMQMEDSSLVLRMRDYYQKIIDAYKTGLPEEKEEITPVTLVKLGNLVLVPLGYEMFSEIGLRLRAYSPYQHTLTLSYSNNRLGYFPSRDQVIRGGYEVLMSRTKGVLNITDDADDYLIQDVLRMIDKF